MNRQPTVLMRMCNEIRSKERDRAYLVMKEEDPLLLKAKNSRFELGYIISTENGAM